MNKYKFSIAFLGFMLGSYAIQAQSDSGGSATNNPNIWNWVLNNLLVLAVAIILIVGFITIFKLSFDLMRLEKTRQLREAGLLPDVESMEEGPSFWQRMNDKAWSLVPLKEEASIDLGHSYDGIRELDNRLPPWWLGLFYGCIAFAFIYMYQYEWSDNNWSSIGEYEQEMEQGEKAKKKYLSKMANLVNEDNVVLLVSEEDLELGKSLFGTSCLACHGAFGEGNSIGPNLTDEYWIHGGGIKDVFKTIKYGVPDKGMISWKDQIKPAMMQRVSSYILSLQGTNPPNAKEAQGKLYVATD